LENGFAAEITSGVNGTLGPLLAMLHAQNNDELMELAQSLSASELLQLLDFAHMRFHKNVTDIQVLIGKSGSLIHYLNIRACKAGKTKRRVRRAAVHYYQSLECGNR
jgi:hypothetical protein